MVTTASKVTSKHGCQVFLNGGASYSVAILSMIQGLDKRNEIFTIADRSGLLK